MNVNNITRHPEHPQVPFRNCTSEMVHTKTFWFRLCRVMTLLCIAISITYGNKVMAESRSVQIIDLPAVLDSQYDITWKITIPRREDFSITLNVEVDSQGRGYQAGFTNGRADWRQVGLNLPSSVPVSAPVSWQPGRQQVISLKRRLGTVALLLDHRLLLVAPAPSSPSGTILFRQVPMGVLIADARYRNFGPRVFGDDFMRSESTDELIAAQTQWVEDPIWHVKSYHGIEEPGSRPPGPLTGKSWSNPWQVSLFPMEKTSTNGFWFFYCGVGPSWAIAAPMRVYNSWDRYYLEASVKPEYDSTVGIIAAYQDNRNYLLFRWRQQQETPRGPAAELIAYRDGQPYRLASASRGFLPAQWYRLRINLGWQSVQALVDGEVLMSAANVGPVEGRIGLYADGSAAPRRPKLDTATASMYMVTDAKTGQVINDAADALRTSSCVYFDDICTGNWETVDSLRTPLYRREETGCWRNEGACLHAMSAGKILVRSPQQQRYQLSTQLRLEGQAQAALLFHLDEQHTGYAWVISGTRQQLRTIAGANMGATLVELRGTLADRAMDRAVRGGRWSVCRALLQRAAGHRIL